MKEAKAGRETSSGSFVDLERARICLGWDSVLRRNRAEQPVVFSAGTCGEVESLRVAHPVGAEGQLPQSGVGDYSA